MSNIRVDLDYAIRDGLELKFRSPVDCSQITGLIVYYPGADGNTVSKVFALSDAHGSNVGDIDHLFAENVVVKVILDVTTSMAFVQNADTNAYLEAQFAQRATSPKTANGSLVSVADSGDAPLHGLKIYGKTTQNGTPTPDAPVALESVGADGSIGVTVYGKNFVDLLNTLSSTSLPQIIALESNSITLSGTSTGTWQASMFRFFLPAGRYTFSAKMETDKGYLNLSIYASNQLESGYTAVTNLLSSGATSFTIEKAKYVAVRAHFTGDVSTRGETWTTRYYDIQLERNEVATDFVEGNNQILTASTPNGLPGIPVSSSGNYTDENGQQWICDEVDFEKGMYVQRIGEMMYDGTTKQFRAAAKAGAYTGTVGYEYLASYACDTAMCTHYPFEKVTITSSELTKDRSFSLYRHPEPDVAMSGVLIYDTSFANAEELNAFLAENPLTVLYAMREEKRTQLTAEELAAFKAVHSHKPNTTIYNDAGADMEVSYFTPNAAVPMNVGSGAKGKVLGIDEHGCVVPKSVTEMGAAPAVDSLVGNTTIVINSISELDNITANGWYKFYQQGAGLNNIWFNYAHVRVSNYSEGSHCVQELYPIADNTPIVRCMFEGVWREWESVNPPMVPGVEYRTTKRWDDKAVYTKLLSLGNLPNTGEKTVAIGETVTRMLSCSVTTRNSVLPDYNAGPTPAIVANADTTNVTLVTSVDASIWLGYATLEYTKD